MASGLGGHPLMTFTRRGSGQCGRMWMGGREGQAHVACGRPHREFKNLFDLRVKIEFFYEKTKKVIRYPKSEKFPRKGVIFSDGIWTSTRGVRLMLWTHVDRGRSQKADFRVDIKNGWPHTRFNNHTHYMQGLYIFLIFNLADHRTIPSTLQGRIHLCKNTYSHRPTNLFTHVCFLIHICI